MIYGAHAIIYSKDADADRAFVRDVLKYGFADAGHGWLIFSLPPAELAFHPSERDDVHELFLMCDDVHAFAHPGAPELCDRYDDDCSGGGGVLTAEDADSDMHSPPSAACSGGFPKDDCDDTNPGVYSGGTPPAPFIYKFGTEFCQVLSTLPSLAPAKFCAKPFIKGGYATFWLKENVSLFQRIIVERMRQKQVDH